jgi:hypothetical protein
MANQISVTNLVANALLAEFSTNNSLILTGARTYESDMPLPAYRTGDTIQIRRQNQFLVSDGRVGVIQPVIETTEPLTIAHQFHSEIEYSSKELTMFVDTGAGPFNERYVRPIIQNISKQFESAIAEDAKLQLNYVSGNPSAPVNSFSVLDLTYAKMQSLAIQVNNDAYLALDPFQAAALRDTNQNAFNSILNTDISFASRLGHMSVFDVFSNQSIPTQTVGVGAVGATVASTPLSGATTVNLTGLGATVTGVYNAGDIIYFDSVNSVNPLDRRDTRRLMSFTVQSQVNSDGAGNATVTISPAIISDPASPYRNVSIPVVATMPVTLEGTPGSTYTVNLAYPPRGLDIVIPPMEVLNNVDTSVVTDKDLNISLRVGRQGNLLNDVNMLRVDILCGWKWHQQYGIRVHSL